VRPDRSQRTSHLPGLSTTKWSGQGHLRRICRSGFQSREPSHRSDVKGNPRCSPSRPRASAWPAPKAHNSKPRQHPIPHRFIAHLSSPMVPMSCTVSFKDIITSSRLHSPPTSWSLWRCLRRWAHSHSLRVRSHAFLALLLVVRPWYTTLATGRWSLLTQEERESCKPTP
jgi:hypothetical protein